MFHEVSNQAALKISCNCPISLPFGDSIAKITLWYKCSQAFTKAAFQAFRKGKFAFSKKMHYISNS
jgi:hypothetical protein